MTKRTLTIFLYSLLLLGLWSCGKPVLNNLTPSSGPEHTIVEIDGSDGLSQILWDASAAVPDTLPGYWLGGGPFSVPPGATLGNHEVALVRGNDRSDATVNFNVTAATVPFPDPSLSHISTLFSETVSAGRVQFFLFVQGPNIDIGAKIVVDGTEYESSLWKLYDYSSAGLDPATLKYPIYHYAMIFAIVEANVGDVLDVSIKNLDDNLSNTVNYTVPTEAEWDSDGDGLLDTWEENGFDSDGDGIVDCDLPGMGANKFAFDIFVEVDYMDGETVADPDKIPDVASWDIIQDSYESSPLINLWQGLQGIQLHIDRGQSTFTDLEGIVHTIPVGERRGGQVLAFSNFIRMDAAATPFAAVGQTTVNFYDLKASNFDIDDRREIFHYCIFANSHGHSSGSTGRAETYGNDLFITMSDFRLAISTSVAGTFLHELGHNMDLQHGGDDNNSDKPNHVSIMGYYSFDNTFDGAYQIGGVDTDCNATVNGVYDYSHGMHQDLTETNLDETIGNCDNTNVDWNGDGVFTAGVSFDLDGDGVNSATPLTDHNNWGSTFKFNFRDAVDYND